MHSLSIRNIDDETYKLIKQESEKNGVSINKLIVRLLKKTFNKKEQGSKKYHDLDKYFGSWTEEEYKIFSKNIEVTEIIDEELWK